MKRASGARIVVESLKREGVETLFAYPGAASMELHQALRGTGIRVVLPRHEQGGGFAAGGYARATGKTGVCIATSGPGATNLVTAITDAYMDSIPLVAITAQVNQKLIGKNAFQETDIIGMTRLVVKHSYLVLSVEELADVMKDAFYIASHGRPGPVVVDITCDVLSRRCEPVFPDQPSLRAFSFLPELEEQTVEALLKKLRSSRRPCIFAGGGVIHSGAARKLLRFAEKWQIPVATSLMGIGAFPENHPLSLKFLGMHGTYCANAAVQHSDLLLCIGVRFSDRVTGNIAAFAPEAFIVHVDVDNSEINKNKHADLPVLADADALLSRLLPEPASFQGRKSWLEQVAAWRDEHPLKIPATSGLHGAQVISRISAKTRGRAVIVTGVGQNQMWAAQFFTYRRPRQLLTSGGLGAMGFGLPAAIGACIGLQEEGKNAPVILIDGDGSFQMNIQELATVYAENLPLKMVILNNQLLGMVAQWEDRFYHGHRGNTELSVPRAKRPYPDFCGIAAAYGIPGREVWEAKELEDALREMLEAKGPFLLDVHILQHESVFPMIPAGKGCDEIILE